MSICYFTCWLNDLGIEVTKSFTMYQCIKIAPRQRSAEAKRRRFAFLLNYSLEMYLFALPLAELRRKSWPTPVPVVEVRARAGKGAGSFINLLSVAFYVELAAPAATFERSCQLGCSTTCCFSAPAMLRFINRTRGIDVMLERPIDWNATLSAVDSWQKYLLLVPESGQIDVPPLVAPRQIGSFFTLSLPWNAPGHLVRPVMMGLGHWSRVPAIRAPPFVLHLHAAK